LILGLVISVEVYRRLQRKGQQVPAEGGMAIGKI